VNSLLGLVPVQFFAQLQTPRSSGMRVGARRLPATVTTVTERGLVLERSESAGLCLVGGCGQPAFRYSCNGLSGPDQLARSAIGEPPAFPAPGTGDGHGDVANWQQSGVNHG